MVLESDEKVSFLSVFLHAFMSNADKLFILFKLNWINWHWLINLVTTKNCKYRPFILTVKCSWYIAKEKNTLNDSLASHQNDKLILITYIREIFHMLFPLKNEILIILFPF